MLPLKSLPLVHFGESFLENQLQENVRKIVEPVVQTSLLDGNWIRGVVLSGTGGEAQVSHRLGRPYRGYWVTRAISQVTPPTLATLIVCESMGANINPALYLVLDYTGNAISMDLWVF